jgi:hypothetical protein
VTGCSKVKDANQEEANNSRQLELVFGAVFDRLYCFTGRFVILGSHA